MESKRSESSSFLNSWEGSDKHILVEKRVYSPPVHSMMCDRLLEVGEPVIISEVFQFIDVMKLAG
eukprot:12365309-Ditylum_brightwellii.AAC.1